MSILTDMIQSVLMSLSNRIVNNAVSLTGVEMTELDDGEQWLTIRWRETPVRAIIARDDAVDKRESDT